MSSGDMKIFSTYLFDTFEAIDTYPGKYQEVVLTLDTAKIVVLQGVRAEMGLKVSAVSTPLLAK